MDYLETRELYHHGIKGQKWGVRRYQYEDGTWTEEGRKRYGKGLSNSGQNRVNARYGKKINELEPQRAKKEKELDPERAERRKQMLKKAAIAATAVAVTALAAYGVKKLKDSKIVEDGKEQFTKSVDLSTMISSVDDAAHEFFYDAAKNDGMDYDFDHRRNSDILPAKNAWDIWQNQREKAKAFDEARAKKMPGNGDKGRFIADPFWNKLAKDLDMSVEELYELKKPRT